MSELTTGTTTQIPVNASEDGSLGVVPELSNLSHAIVAPQAAIGAAHAEIIPSPTLSFEVAPTQEASEIIKSAQASAAHDETVAEKTAEEIVEEVQDKADTDQGQEELKDDIEDSIDNVDLPDNVDVDEALDEIVDELSDGILDAEVIGVEAGEEVVVTTEDGKRVKVELEKGEDYAVYVTEDGDSTIVIDETLSEEEAAEATTDALADIIHDVAAQNGVDLDGNFAAAFRTGFMASVFYTLRLFNVMIGGKDPYVIIAERTGESEDEMVTRVINEERALAEMRPTWRKLHK